MIRLGQSEEERSLRNVLLRQIAMQEWLTLPNGSPRSSDSGMQLFSTIANLSPLPSAPLTRNGLSTSSIGPFPSGVSFLLRELELRRLQARLLAQQGRSSGTTAVAGSSTFHDVVARNVNQSFISGSPFSLMLSSNGIPTTVSGSAISLSDTATIPGLTTQAKDSVQYHAVTSTAASASKKDRQLLQQELDLIPTNEKEAYLAAKEICSVSIRQEEANEDWFLRTEELRYEAAALRIVNYWQCRKETFGFKMFDPLHQTNEGALQRADLTVLGTGFLSIVPNDSSGCPVLFLNASRLKGSPSMSIVRRCMFYMFSLMAEDLKTQDVGAVLLVKVDDGLSRKIDMDFVKRLGKCLPIRFKAVHLLSHEGISPRVVDQFRICEQVYLHVNSERTEFVQKLKQFGLLRHDLPRSLGGGWGYDKFVLWQELRTRMEWKIPFGLSGRDASGSMMFVRESQGVVPFQELTEAGKRERQRKMNVIHSRRKRDKDRVEIDRLRDLVVKLTEDQKGLREENQLLERMFASEPTSRLLTNQSGTEHNPTSKSVSGDLTRLSPSLKRKQMTAMPSSLHSVVQAAHRRLQSTTLSSAQGAANGLTVANRLVDAATMSNVEFGKVLASSVEIGVDLNPREGKVRRV